jgi:hypothetical protein
MASAIQASGYPVQAAYPAQAGGAPSVAALEARLARCEKELAECVNCDTADTREGKQAIQELTIRIGETRARIEEVAAAAVPATAPASADLASTSAAANTGGPLGSRLDVFA